MSRTAIYLSLLLSPVLLLAQGQGGTGLPDAPGRETVQRVCSTCHPAAIVLGRGMNREQWGGIVSNMISRGAKGSDEEFAQIVDYLSKNLPPSQPGAAPAATGTAPKARRRPSMLDQAGANDKHVVDEEAAKRGRTIYIAQCITCHGTRARGSERGADLIRSLVVLHDRYGSTIGPYLAKGHPQGKPVALNAKQVEDLSHFLHEQVGDTLRTGPFNKVLNILVGDPKAGEEYFNGAGKCNSCHSPTGDLAHVASKYDPPALQLKVVFPQTAAFGRRSAANSRKPITATVTTESGETLSGVIEEIDDFNVTVRDDSGRYRTIARGPGVKVEKHDPYAAHVALLDEYTDKQIHDVVAYLETLK
jgi:mono/diheme cytochrome c family protein